MMLLVALLFSLAVAQGYQEAIESSRRHEGKNNNLNLLENSRSFRRFDGYPQNIPHRQLQYGRQWQPQRRQYRPQVHRPHLRPVSSSGHRGRLGYGYANWLSRGWIGGHAHTFAPESASTDDTNSWDNPWYKQGYGYGNGLAYNGYGYGSGFASGYGQGYYGHGYGHGYTRGYGHGFGQENDEDNVDRSVYGHNYGNNNNSFAYGHGYGISNNFPSTSAKN